MYIYLFINIPIYTHTYIHANIHANIYIIFVNLVEVCMLVHT